ncbi:MAG: hypothetical protein C0393_01530 [Anaerolinea sp.]|nr:hypothetical protein [Anaerolinea sp.]
MQCFSSPKFCPPLSPHFRAVLRKWGDERGAGAVSAGYFHSKTWQKDYPRIQILTIEELLAGKGIDMPPSAYGTFKQAGKVKKQEGKQPKLISVA